jgi:serine/threonine protein phosphatase PrpC
MISKRTAAWGESHVGYVRKNNQDRYLVKELPEIIILAVADGIGGCPGGELAAQIVIDETQKYRFSPKKIENDLSMVLVKAEEHIHHTVNKNPDLEGMGTTATIVVLYKNKVFWINVGDSRLYLLHNTKIKQITTDHTFIQDLIEDGSLTPEQAKTHPLRNMLDQCVGMGDTQPDCGVFKTHIHDQLLLCSDGLTKHLSDLQIESILNTNPAQVAVQQLIQTALKMGGTDNVTVIVKEGN